MSFTIQKREKEGIMKNQSHRKQECGEKREKNTTLLSNQSQIERIKFTS